MGGGEIQGCVIVYVGQSKQSARSVKGVIGGDKGLRWVFAAKPELTIDGCGVGCRVFLFSPNMRFNAQHAKVYRWGLV